jgi:archaellum component FlaC
VPDTDKLQLEELVRLDTNIVEKLEGLSVMAGALERKVDGLSEKLDGLSETLARVRSMVAKVGGPR